MELARQHLLRRPPGQAHAMGVCGVGVSGVAVLLRARGWRVSGCDRHVDPAMAAWLAERGVAVAAGHDPAHLAGCDLLLLSAAVPDGEAEPARARAAGVPVIRRGVALAALAAGRRAVTVCGTHGKTTTACFVTRLLQTLGDAPDWCIGGATRALGGVAGTDGGGPLVVEADESDGTLALHEPAVAVVTNIDDDHLDHFGGPRALRDCFAAAASRAREGVVFGADDEGAAAVCADLPRALGFGFGGSARLRGAVTAMDAARMRLAVSLDGRSLGSVELGVAGRHNALNALAALGAAIALGHAPQDALAALAALDELPARRFETVTAAAGVRVVTDYAHHPAEIAALVELARLQRPRRLLALFQPHRYSRTKALAARFPAAFRGVDVLLLAPVYAAAETPLDGGRAEDLYRAFRDTAAAGVPVPRLVSSPEAAWHWLRDRLRPGDLLLVTGAGDVAQVARRAAGEKPGCAAPPPTAPAEADFAAIPGVRAFRDAPLARLTTLGTGGAADLLLEVETPAALAAVLRLCAARGLPWHLLAGGANTLVDDLGVRGATIRLAGKDFREYAATTEGLVTAGCGWSGQALLERLTGEGLGGLEFLEGVPGHLGGWLAMNAGAHGGQIGSRVVRLHGLQADGSAVTLTAAQAGFGYRRCAALGNMVALRAELALAPSSPREVAARRAAFRARRLDLRGLRTAGSVFLNPPGETAGKLLEQAGCKTLRVGGARVCGRHANVIVLETGATASDMLALMALMRQRVRALAGVELTAEIRHLQ